MADLLPDHSPLGASAMYRWLPCPGSVQLAVGHNEEPSDYAKEGTDAHSLAQLCLAGNDDAWEYIGGTGIHVTKRGISTLNMGSTVRLSIRCSMAKRTWSI